MALWYDVANEMDIPPGTLYEAYIEDNDLLIINVNHQFYAIQNLCTHDGGNLSLGHIEGCEIVCPRHGAHFCLKSGVATLPPAYEDIQTYETRVHEGVVQVLLQE